MSLPVAPAPPAVVPTPTQQPPPQQQGQPVKCPQCSNVPSYATAKFCGKCRIPLPVVPNTHPAGDNDMRPTESDQGRDVKTPTVIQPRMAGAEQKIGKVLFLGRRQQTPTQLLASLRSELDNFAPLNTVDGVNLMNNRLGSGGKPNDLGALMARLPDGAMRVIQAMSSEVDPAALQAILIAANRRGASMQKLNLRFNQSLGDAGVQFLTEASCVDLEVLTLTGCGITTEGATVLGKRFADGWAPKLRELNLSQNPAITDVGTSALFKGLGSRQLTIDVSNCGVADGALRTLASHCRPSELRCCDNDVTHDGMKALVPLIVGENACLRSLVLSNNRVGDRGVLSLMAACAAPGRSMPAQLEILSLDNNRLSDLGLQALIPLLEADIISGGGPRKSDVSSPSASLSGGTQSPRSASSSGMHNTSSSSWGQQQTHLTLHLGANPMHKATLEALKEAIAKGNERRRILNPSSNVRSVREVVQPIWAAGPGGMIFRQQDRRLVHVTSSSKADQIQKHGFLRGADGLLGPGIYFGRSLQEVCGKALQSSATTALLCQVDLGQMCKASTPGPFPEEYDSCECTFTSTPEWVVRDPSRVKIVRRVELTTSLPSTTSTTESFPEDESRGVFLCANDGDDEVQLGDIAEQFPIFATNVALLGFDADDVHDELAKLAADQLVDIVRGKQHAVCAVSAESLLKDAPSAQCEDAMCVRLQMLCAEVVVIHGCSKDIDLLQGYCSNHTKTTTRVALLSPTAWDAMPEDTTMMGTAGKSIDIAVCVNPEEDKTTLKSLMETAVLSSVCPGIRLTVFEHNEFYKKYLRPALADQLVLEDLTNIASSKTGSSMMMKDAVDGRPLWLLIDDLPGEHGFVVEMNRKNHPETEKWTWGFRSDDGDPSIFSLQDGAKFVAWWVHRDFFKSVPGSPESVPAKVNFMAVRKQKPEEYLHCIRDVTSRDAPALKQLREIVTTWIAANLGVSKDTIETNLHYPNGGPVSTLHIHFRYKFKDELDSINPNIRAVKPEALYGFKTGRSTPLDSLIASLECASSTAAVKKLYSRYQVWSTRPCWASLTGGGGDVGSPYTIFNNALAFLGDPSHAAQMFREQLVDDGTWHELRNVYRGGVMLVIVGDSAAGKDTALAHVRTDSELHGYFTYPKRIVTRDPRGNCPEDYTPMSLDEFRRMTALGEIALPYYHLVDSTLAYGFPASFMTEMDGKTTVPVLNIARFALDPIAALCAERGILLACLNVKAPLDCIERQMRARNRDSAEEIERRLEMVRRRSWDITATQSRHVFTVNNDSTLGAFHDRVDVALACVAQLSMAVHESSADE